MKKMYVLLLSSVALGAIIMFSAFANSQGDELKSPPKEEVSVEQQQMVNLFVTHGHCSTPFSGKVDGLKVVTSSGEGNPLDNMQLSFEIDPESFTACIGEEITRRVKTPGLFIDEENQQKIKFTSTRVFTMGVDWYEVNGILSIKGIENEVKFFVSGIRNPLEMMASKLVLEGQINLKDWGIDYDKQVFGESNEHPTQWMHINMKINLPQNC